jgi:hypothetical protein
MMSKPLIRIDDEVREMTDDEYSWYVEHALSVKALDETTDSVSDSVE